MVLFLGLVLVAGGGALVALQRRRRL